MTPPPVTATMRTRHAVSPEIAAAVREEDQACSVAIATANAILTATIAAARVQVEAAHARHRAAMRPILRQLLIEDDAIVVETDGYGADTAIVVQRAAPAPTTPPSEVPHA